ncbi:hypothetical protein ACOMHN_059574 [Nucella lapillus]
MLMMRAKVQGHRWVDHPAAAVMEARVPGQWVDRPAAMVMEAREQGRCWIDHPAAAVMEARVQGRHWVDRPSALLRPGRFDRLLYVPLPDADARLQILQIIRQRTRMANDVCLHDLVSQTDRFSGAELTALCQEAGIQAMWENRKAREVHQRHFDAALRTVWPRTTQDTIHLYENFTAHRAV